MAPRVGFEEKKVETGRRETLLPSGKRPEVKVHQGSIQRVQRFERGRRVVRRAVDWVAARIPGKRQVIDIRERAVEPALARPKVVPLSAQTPRSLPDTPRPSWVKEWIVNWPRTPSAGVYGKESESLLRLLNDNEIRQSGDKLALTRNGVPRRVLDTSDIPNLFAPGTKATFIQYMGDAPVILARERSGKCHVVMFDLYGAKVLSRTYAEWPEGGVAEVRRDGQVRVYFNPDYPDFALPRPRR